MDFRAKHDEQCEQIEQQIWKRYYKSRIPCGDITGRKLREKDYEGQNDYSSGGNSYHPGDTRPERTERSLYASLIAEFPEETRYQDDSDEGRKDFA